MDNCNFQLLFNYNLYEQISSFCLAALALNSQKTEKFWPFLAQTLKFGQIWTLKTTMLTNSLPDNPKTKM